MPINKPSPSSSGGLGQKVENTLVRFITIAYENTIGAISLRIRAGIDQLLEDFEQEAVKVVRPYADKLLENPDLPDWFRNYLMKVAYPDKQVGVLGVGTALAALGWSLMSVVSASMGNRAVQWVNMIMRPALPDLSTIAAMYHKGIGSFDDFEAIAQRLGYRQEFIVPFLEFTENKVSASEFIRHALLVGLDDKIVTAYLLVLGYKDTEIMALLNINQLRPGAGDLVRFGVREVWRDDVASKWGYDADFPPEFSTEMERAGDREGWSKAFWRAHWELPSLQMCLEMLHREVITQDEFDEYLRIADYPVGWRDRIKQVVYTPYTRVDTRRMYRFGVLDEEAVFKNYKDIGYDDEHALSMAEFTILDALEPERELTKADILKSYKLGRFNALEAKQGLIDLGYNAVLADILLSNQDQVLEDQRINSLVSNTHAVYVRGGLTESEVMVRLSSYNLGSGEIERYLELWNLERESKIALPSRSVLDGFLRDDIITVPQYRNGLRRLSYLGQSIEWFTQSILLDKQALAEKERDRALDEQEKLIKRGLATEYQQKKAQLTVELREIEASIGEWQNAIQARGLQFKNDQELAKQRLTVEGLEQEYIKNKRAINYQINHITTKNKESLLTIDEIQTEIASIVLAMELVIDESLLEQGKLSIAKLKEQRELIEAIVVEAQVEIAELENAIIVLVDQSLTTVIQQDIAVLQEEIEVLQDKIAADVVVLAQIKRDLLDATADEAVALMTLNLDTELAIAQNQELIDHLQTEIQGFRINNVRPELVKDLNDRQDLISALQVEIAEADILFQEIDATIAHIRVEQIDPASIQEIEKLQTAVLAFRVKIENEQDVIAANNVLISDHRAQLRGLGAQYQQSLIDLQRVESMAVVVSTYNRDLSTLQSGLATDRNRKNMLKVALAKLKYQFIQ